MHLLLLLGDDGRLCIDGNEEAVHVSLLAELALVARETAIVDELGPLVEVPVGRLVRLARVKVKDGEEEPMILPHDL